MKKRTGEPWMPADRYGRGLPPLSLNLIVRNVEKSVLFYERVLGAAVEYSDADFAALRVGSAALMLHADHTYDKHPWYGRLVADEPRGLGAEIRLLGMDPDAVEAQAVAAAAVIVQPATTKSHGWREVMVEDPDGYVWAVGLATGP
jgi:uncharacterized glyoxalase superfamily protein PhnB